MTQYTRLRARIRQSLLTRIDQLIDRTVARVFSAIEPTLTAMHSQQVSFERTWERRTSELECQRLQELERQRLQELERQCLSELERQRLDAAEFERQRQQASSDVAWQRLAASELGWQRLSQASAANLAIGIESGLFPQDLTLTKHLLHTSLVGGWTIVASQTDLIYLAEPGWNGYADLKSYVTANDVNANVCVANLDLANLVSLNENLVRAAAARCRKTLLLLARIDPYESRPDFASLCEGSLTIPPLLIDKPDQQSTARRIRVWLHRAGFQDVIGPIYKHSVSDAPISRADLGLGNHHVVREKEDSSDLSNPFAFFLAHRYPLDIHE